MPPTNRPRSSLIRGDIVLAHFPFTDLSETKLRPAVILWASATQTDFLIAFISSQNVADISDNEVALLSSHAEFALTGLRVPSKIRTERLVTLSRSLITRRLGKLGPALISELDSALIATLGLRHFSP